MELKEIGVKNIKGEKESPQKHPVLNSCLNNRAKHVPDHGSIRGVLVKPPIGSLNFCKNIKPNPNTATFNPRAPFV